jgi:ribose transport system permease protein
LKKKYLESVKNFVNNQKLLIIIIFIIIILSSIDISFLSLGSIINTIRHMAIDGVMAVGMTILLVSGEFDLSIGSVMSLSGIVAVLILPYGLPLALIGGLMVGFIFGFINGTLTVIGRIQAFISTLGTMIVGKSLALILTSSVPISSFNEYFNMISSIEIIGISSLIYILIIVFAIGWYLLKYTRFGKYAYAIGSNENSARLAGIKVNKHKITYFVFCSVFASIAGILIASKTNTGSPVIGDDVTLIIVAIAVLGGASLSGGKGKIIGTLQALIIFELISKSMITLNINQIYQYIFRGFIILVVVISDAITNKENFRY